MAIIVTRSVTSSDEQTQRMLNLFYPVGSYYETSDTTFDPNTAWGGTWVEDTAGRILVSQDTGTFTTVGDTGGSETHHHTYGVGVGEYFGQLSGNILAYDGVNNTWEWGTTGANITVRHHDESTYAEESISTRRASTNTTNDSSLQPYIVVKRWHRTA